MFTLFLNSAVFIDAYSWLLKRVHTKVIHFCLRAIIVRGKPKHALIFYWYISDIYRLVFWNKLFYFCLTTLYLRYWPCQPCFPFLYIFFLSSLRKKSYALVFTFIYSHIYFLINFSHINAFFLFRFDLCMFLYLSIDRLLDFLCVCVCAQKSIQNNQTRRWCYFQQY